MEGQTLSSTSLISKKGPKETITPSFASIFSNVNTLLAPPTRTLLGALPPPKWDGMRDRVPSTWSLAMVYHAYPELTGMECITRAVVYFSLCIGIKCLMMISSTTILMQTSSVRRIGHSRGAISIERAWLFFALQVMIGVFLAYKVLSPDALRISMYRWMYFAPIPLGLMFNIGVYMGRADLTPDGVIPCHALTAAYFGATMWTITYETVYQHQDKVDDVKIGMKSLAILANVMGSHYVSVALSAFVELLVTDIDKPRQCMQFFLHTPTIGNLILAGSVVDAVVHRIVEGIPL
ncbi:hypothetical protein EV421DRAFT_2036760 [Armillaria borealis]|uniref:Uncharacterized protein n=1 Tax=Armillaria borealis TaxID=47425 RepID=A0AA39JDT0_9AGAR|nr:hypothetical protein EV421DRAFT_2036760 [Armillaria borealis]